MLGSKGACGEQLGCWCNSHRYAERKTRSREFSYAYTDVRFKSNGLESIEVQDNGAGISTENFETVGKLITEARRPTAHRSNSLEALHFKAHRL